jgi:flagellar hook-length control protein FliK
MTVELHPAELGRVEIRFSFHPEGLTVRMTLDRPETFAAFSRDRAGLEQQLAQAGVDLAGGGLDLRLGQQSDQSNGYSAESTPRVKLASSTPATAPASSRVRNGLIDILA